MTGEDDRRSAALDATLRQLGAEIVPVEDSEHALRRRARIVPELSAHADRVFRTAPQRSLAHKLALAAVVVSASLGIIGFRLLRGGREVASGAPNPTIRVSEGPVRIFHGGATTSGDEHAPAALSARDRIETGAGHAEVSLATGALVEVEAQSDVELGEVVRNAGALAERIDLGEGRIHVRVPKLPPGGRLTIGTPQAIVTVHGTAFIVDVRKASAAGSATTTVSVSEGRVSVESGGREIFLGPGSQWTSSGSAAELDSTQAAAPSGTAAANPAASVAPSHGAARARATAAPGSSLAAENELFRSAMAARRAGDPKTAVELLDRLLSTYPTTPLGEEARAERDRARAELGGKATP
jgi:hypothetical protein